MAYTHSWRDLDAKRTELHDLTINEIAERILDLEVELEECGGKLNDTEERLDAALAQLDDAAVSA